MKKLRVLALMHPDLVPPPDAASVTGVDRFRYKTEFDVVSTLQEMGHEVRVLGVQDELHPIRDAVDEFRPDIAFNLLEEFQGSVLFDQNVVSLLELLRVSYTGCNPRGLIISREKALSKKLLVYHRIRVPDFHVFAMGRKVRRRIKTDAIAEQYIDGREVYVSVLGNERLTAFPPRELVIESAHSDAPVIATERVKHDPSYQVRHGIEHRRATDLPASVAAALPHLSKRIYRILNLSGYARVDYRVSADGLIWFLEANPNPEIAREEEFASAALDAGINYPELLQRLLNLGLKGTGPEE
jgi:D-alanine-D-alanine ligase